MKNDLYGGVLDKIIWLYEKYSLEYRASTQPYRLQTVKNILDDYKYDINDLLVREPLIEHSGSLPIVATAIYPYINNDNVDLGRALIMLAIHDIGELAVGDQITFTKTSDGGEEKRQALKILPKNYHDIYLEMENRTSDTARFAKAVDKMTPDIVDLMSPAEVTVERYKSFVKKEPREIVETIKEFKHPYMIWNDFMKNLHLEILARIDQKVSVYY